MCYVGDIHLIDSHHISPDINGLRNRSEKTLAKTIPAIGTAPHLMEVDPQDLRTIGDKKLLNQRAAIIEPSIAKIGLINAPVIDERLNAIVGNTHLKLT